MVEVLGHFGMALLWALPAWFRWDGPVSLAFIAFALSTAMLPDVDLVLRHVLPGVHHHGVTHTVVFVVGVAVVGGAIAAFGLAPLVERRWLAGEGRTIPRRDAYEFGAVGLLVGGLSHVFADMLSAPDISEPVEPLWPFLDKPFSLDVIYYSAPEWNGLLLLVAVFLHAVIAAVDRGAFGLMGRRT